MNLNEYTLYITSLLRCAVTGETPSHIPDGMDAATLLKLASDHQINSIVYKELSKIHAITDSELLNKAENEYNYSIAYDTAQSYYIDMITAVLEENNINYLVLKGNVIKDIYPSPELRQRADIDIYIGHGNAQKVHDIMLGMGFECLTFGENNTSDNYKTDQYSYVEFHRQLIKDKYKWTDECNRITDRLIHKSGCEYVMSDEDYYVFMIAHIAKHMKWGGIGIRAILDVWIYRRHFCNLNFKYINNVLEQCSLTEFHKNVSELCTYWFDNATETDKMRQLSIYVASSGWNGTYDQNVSGALAYDAGNSSSKLVARLKMYTKAIFWNREKMEVRYPALNKVPILLPFCWIHRAMNAVFNKRDTIRKTYARYDNGDMETGKRINEFRASIGL